MGNEDVAVCKDLANSQNVREPDISLHSLKINIENTNIGKSNQGNDQEDTSRVDFTRLLPPETVEEIFQYLTPKDLASCSAVSTSWREAVNSNKVWGYLCDRKGWKDDFDPNFSHFVRAHKQFRKWTHSCDLFSPLCQKRLLYNKHAVLQNNWRCGKYIAHKIANDIDTSWQLFEPVTCDGRYLVMLEKFSKYNKSPTLAVWSLDGIPFKLSNLPLPNTIDPVDAVAFDHGTIVVVQAWEISVYKLQNGKFEFVYSKQDLKELEPHSKLPKTMKQFSPFLKVTEDFIICVPNNSHSTVDFIPIIFWDRLTGETKHKLSFESMYFSITCAVWYKDTSCFLSLSNKKKKTYHVVEFNVKEANWAPFNESVTLEIEQVVVSNQYVVAVTKTTNPAIRQFFSPRSEHNNKTVWIWDRVTGTALNSLEVQGKSFQFVDGYLMYYDSSKVTVIDPKNPDFSSEFAVTGTISSIKAALHPSLMVIIKTGCYIEVWDWGLGCRLYTITSEFKYGSQLWCDDKRIITYHSADNPEGGGILVLGFW